MLLSFVLIVVDVSCYLVQASSRRHAAVHLTDVQHCCDRFSLSLSLSLSLFLHLTTNFPGEPGLAGFTRAKDDGSGGDNWSY